MPLDAKVLWKDALRDDVAPRLRQMGFKGSGQVFRLPEQHGYLASIGFQGNQHNTRAMARYRLSMSIVCMEEFRAKGWSALPQPTALYPGLDKAVQASIGMFLATKHDHWWMLGQPLAVAPVVDDILWSVQSVMLPMMVAVLNGGPLPTIDLADDDGRRCPWPGCQDDFDW
jgi:hypothetical protein